MKPFNKLLPLILISFYSLKCDNPPTNLIQNQHQHTHIHLSVFPASEKEAIKKAYNGTKEWLKKNKWAIGGASIATVYAFLASKISAGRIVLYNTDSWTNWKSDTSLTQLLDKKTSDLSKELHQSILDKYANNNQNDLIAPIVRFVSDLEKEISKLKTFCNISKRLKQFRLVKIFLITEKEITKANEKVNRLLYIKNIVTDSIKVSLNK